ncbi:hypothetical protein KY311_02100 [Candidatus Woesearchaeota archaeon]|nr:hypothetical protein [Candidatus Woesearchaeota archaeon]
MAFLKGMFKKKREMKKEAPKAELPQLMPATAEPRKPSKLVSEVEHVRPGAEEYKPEPLPELDFPEFEEPEAPAPMPAMKAKKFELPEFPEKPEFVEQDILEAKELISRQAGFPREHVIIKPVFVDVDDFKRLLDDINMAKSTLSEAKEGHKAVEELRMEQDKKLSKWKSEMEDLQRKFIFIDRTLFEKRIAGD